MTLLAPPPPAPTSAARPAARTAGLARLRGPATTLALSVAGTAAVAQTLGTVVAGRLAERPTLLLVVVLACCLLGAALLDTVGRVVWAGVVDRAEGRVRADLLDAALDQPLPVLAEQAVGEVLDRVDGDTAELGALLRRAVWDVVRTLLRTGPAYVVAGLTWWPAWLLFPLLAAVTARVVRPLTALVAQRKLEEEVAWTDSAAAVEEGIAARDDLRSSLGQAYLLRRSAELSAVVHRRTAATLSAAARLNRRTGLLLYGLLGFTGVAGALLARAGRLSTAELVTLFLVTTSFVGQIDRVSRHLPELQAGLGALTRLRQLLDAEPEPVGGAELPPGPLPLEVRGLSFAYPQGTFALSGVDLTVPAGQVLALVGRTGSGKSTLAALVSRAVEPPPGTVLLGGTDVRAVDLQRLRSAVGVVTQRTELLAATLAENVALFADLPRARVQQAVDALGLQDWVAGLPDGLDTVLGPGGTPLSAGEEQLVAFARLLVRDVRLVVLDEATARMDPVTEQRVVRASERLLSGRTGIVIAHRLATTARADHVAVLEAGRVVQTGPRAELAAQDGPFRALLTAAGTEQPRAAAGPVVAGARRTGQPAGVRSRRARAGLARRVLALLSNVPSWGAGRRAAVPVLLAGRPVRCPHRPALGPHRHRRRARRPARAAAGRAGHRPAAGPAAGRRGVPALPAVVERRPAQGAAGGAGRPDPAAPARPHPARRGRRPRARRPAPAAVRRPLGRPAHRRRRRRAHRPGRPRPAGRGRAAGRPRRLRPGVRARLPARPAAPPPRPRAPAPASAARSPPRSSPPAR